MGFCWLEFHNNMINQATQAKIHGDKKEPLKGQSLRGLKGGNSISMNT